MHYRPLALLVPFLVVASLAGGDTQAGTAATSPTPAETLGSREPGSRATSRERADVLAQLRSSEAWLAPADRQRIQSALNRRGFNVGRPDGVFGRNTRAGIMQYQASIGAPVTGELTAEQIADLLNGGAAQAPDAGATASVSFNIQPGVDLPGNDIAGPDTDPRLGNVDAKGCAELCAATEACGAFTYNLQARACFLKSAAGDPVPFRGAISGRRVAGAVTPASPAAPAQPVPGVPPTATVPSPEAAMPAQSLVGFDLPGNDNAAPIRGVSLEACANNCRTVSACQAFTYNRRAQMCFLKGAVSRPVPHPDAISGTRAGGFAEFAAALPGPVDDPLAHQPGESEADLVARIRATAAPYGGSCEVERAAIERLRRETTVSAAATTVDAGGELVLDWTRGPVPEGRTPQERLPAYLMVATDRPVRFKGDGFYALLPGARAAFGVETFKPMTRAIVPLYGSGTPNSGRITFVPLLAGDLALEWSVVGYLRRCQEEVAGNPSRIAATVQSRGLPTIVLEEDADLSEPIARIGVPEGAQVAGRIIEVSEGGYRLVDEASGAELAERAGRNPRFSPTGRFVAAVSDDGVEMVDAVDGALVYKDSFGGDLAWTAADSFAVFDRGPWGRLEIIAPLRDGQSILAANTACHACGGAESGVRIDLENNAAIVSGEQGAGAARLSSPGEPAEDNTVRSFLQTVEVAPKPLPQQWELGSVVAFTHVAAGYGSGVEKAPALKGRRSVLLKPRRLASERIAASAAARPLETAAWRGLARVAAAPRPSQMVPRMVEFGVPVPDGESPFVVEPERLVLSDNREGSFFHETETAAMADVARRIKAEVSVARDAIVDGPAPFGCDVADSDWNAETEVFTVLKIYGAFQKAFGFDVGGRIVWVTHRRCVQGSAAFSNPSLALFDSEAPAAAFLEQESGDPDISYGASEGTCNVNIADCDFDARMFAGRYVVLSSEESRAIVIYDLDEARIAFKKYQLPHGDLLEDAFVTEDERGVVQVNSDGTFYVYALDDARTLLEGRYVDDEIVVWTPDMRFDSTAEGAHFVNLKFPGQPGQYTFQQFDSRLRVPGLVERVLSGDYEPEAVGVGVPPRLAGTLDDPAEGRVRGSAVANAPGVLKELRVYQDGILTDRIPATASGETVAIDVARLPGARWASLVAVDEEGLASLPMGRDLGPDAGGRAKAHVLSVGINAYESAKVPDLGLAVEDARTLAASVAAAGSTSLEVGEPTLLLDDAASPQAILAAAQALVDNAGRGDTIVFFFAGHGLKGPDGRFYMGTPGTDPADIAATTLAWDDLAAVLASAEARVAVFLDACHSGTAGTDFFATNDEAASGILKNIPSGLVVFSASKGREVSRENPQVGGGFFTTSVAEVIARDRAAHDTNANGAIEISELYTGVKRLVVSQTDGKQTPWLARNQMIGDFALF